MVVDRLISCDQKCTFRWLCEENCASGTEKDVSKQGKLGIVFGLESSSNNGQFNYLLE